jgi:hypothetical protein
MQKNLLRHGVTMVAFLASAAALIATSKAPYSEFSSEAATVDLTLLAGDSRSYMVVINHADRGSGSAHVSLSASASVTATDADTELTLTLTEDDTEEEGSDDDEVVTESVDAEGRTVVAYGDYDIDAIPIIILTLSEDGGVEGSLSVDVGIDWYGDSVNTDESELSVELVEVTEDTE